MCAGAILNARIPRVYYGARDEAMGACGGVVNIYMERFANTPALVGGILAAECRVVLEEFFRSLRNRDATPSVAESCASSIAVKQKDYTQMLEKEFKEFGELESTIKAMREDGMSDEEIYNVLSIF